MILLYLDERQFHKEDGILLFLNKVTMTMFCYYDKTSQQMVNVHRRPITAFIFFDMNGFQTKMFLQ